MVSSEQASSIYNISNMLRALPFLCAILHLATAQGDCQDFLESPREAIKSNFFGNKNHGFFSQFVTQDRHYELNNVIKFKVISSMHKNTAKTALCVGFVDTTSYTKKAGGDTIGWVTMNTDPDVPTGIIEVDAECWELQKDVVPCSPAFFPMSGVMETPLYVHSPLSFKFWPLLSDEQLYAKNWVWRMNTMSKEDPFPSSWVSKIKILSLRELQIIGNDWGLVQDLLSPLPVLTRLDISQNNIQELDPDVLMNAPRLRDLLLARNNLSVFPQNLDKLVNLKLLDITNPRGDAELTITDSDLSTVNGVEIIGLENVNLKTDVTRLLSLEKLRFLNLSGCRINDIGESDFAFDLQTKEKSLEILDLSNNKLSALPSGLFSTLTKLKSLRLHRNGLESCPDEGLERLTELDYLDLADNKIMNIDESCFYTLRKLEYLDLSRNQISNISDGSFQFQQSLKNLKLSGNNLTKLSSEIFGSDRLTIDVLDVSNNQLSEWEVNNSVTHLNLSHNRISKFSSHTFKNFNLTRVIDLGANPFDCCDENRTLLEDWMRNTGTELKSLGTKDLITCSVQGLNQRYAILNFNHERILCSDGNTTFIFIEDSSAWSVATLVMIGGVCLAILFIFISVAVGFLNYYRGKRNAEKFGPLP